MKTEYAGIDYALGKANIDPVTGIRFGVIPASELGEFIDDAFDAEYGDPTCPRCGNNVINSGTRKDFFCDTCFEKSYPDRDVNTLHHDDLEKFTYWSDQCFGDDPIGWIGNDPAYSYSMAHDGDIFITKSLYYTRAQFCSPCAPGAGYLLNPCADGPKVYCFNHDWFDSGIAPYPVYLVSDDSEVTPEIKEEI